MNPEFFRELSADKFSAITTLAVSRLPHHIVKVITLHFVVTISGGSKGGQGQPGGQPPL